MDSDTLVTRASENKINDNCEFQMKKCSLNIKLFKALQGDCILLSYGQNLEKNILIDGGMGIECKRQLQKFMNELKALDRKIDILILTHIDCDHIDGILKMFSSREFDFSIIKLMLFNFGDGLNKKLNISGVEKISEFLVSDRTTEISYRQAKSLEKILRENSFSWNELVKRNDIFPIEDAKITILSPSIEILKEFNTKCEKEKEKKVKIASKCDFSLSVEQLNSKKFEEVVSLANKSSIAFIFEYEGVKLLFLGDAPSSEIENALLDMGYTKESPLEVLCCKISHHASKHNTSSNLIQMIRCHNYIISTNMTASGRPSKECLSRIVCNSEQSVNFYCNYKLDYKRIFTKEEEEKYKMKFYTLDENGITVEELYK